MSSLTIDVLKALYQYGTMSREEVREWLGEKVDDIDLANQYYEYVCGDEQE